MREIKFKAKTEIGNRWIYGHLAMFNDRYYIVGKSDKKEIRPETTCQFINFKDDDDIDVYENDICRSTYSGGDEPIAGVIKFNTDDLCFELQDSLQDNEIYEWKTINVIGNIFD